MSYWQLRILDTCLPTHFNGPDDAIVVPVSSVTTNSGLLDGVIQAAQPRFANAEFKGTLAVALAAARAFHLLNDTGDYPAFTDPIGEGVNCYITLEKED